MKHFPISVQPTDPGVEKSPSAQATIRPRAYCFDDTSTPDQSMVTKYGKQKRFSPGDFRSFPFLTWFEPGSRPNPYPRRRPPNRRSSSPTAPRRSTRNWSAVIHWFVSEYQVRARIFGRSRTVPAARSIVLDARSFPSGERPLRRPSRKCERRCAREVEEWRNRMLLRRTTYGKTVVVSANDISHSAGQPSRPIPIFAREPRRGSRSIRAGRRPPHLSQHVARKHEPGQGGSVIRLQFDASQRYSQRIQRSTTMVHGPA